MERQIKTEVGRARSFQHNGLVNYFHFRRWCVPVCHDNNNNTVISSCIIAQTVKGRQQQQPATVRRLLLALFQFNTVVDFSRRTNRTPQHCHTWGKNEREELRANNYDKMHTFDQHSHDNELGKHVQTVENNNQTKTNNNHERCNQSFHHFLTKKDSSRPTTLPYLRAAARTGESTWYAHWTRIRPSLHVPVRMHVRTHAYTCVNMDPLRVIRCVCHVCKLDDTFAKFVMSFFVQVSFSSFIRPSLHDGIVSWYGSTWNGVAQPY